MATEAAGKKKSQNNPMQREKSVPTESLIGAGGAAGLQARDSVLTQSLIPGRRTRRAHRRSAQ